MNASDSTIHMHWQKLPLARKTYLIATIMATCSPFLPWFSDKSDLVAGDVYLGLTGPSSFLGLSIFMLTSLLLIQELYFMWQQKNLFADSFVSFLHKSVGPTSIYLIAMSASVFLHPTVGNNLLAKHFVWGFYAACLSAITLLIGITFKETTMYKVKPAEIMKTAHENRKHSHTLIIPEKNSIQTEEEAESVIPNGIKLDPDPTQVRSLNIEDLVPKSVSSNIAAKKEWEHQRELESHFSQVQTEDSNIF